MIIIENIGEKVFLEHRSYKVYDSEEDMMNDNPSLSTPDWNKYNEAKQLEREKIDNKPS